MQKTREFLKLAQDVLVAVETRALSDSDTWDYIFKPTAEKPSRYDQLRETWVPFRFDFLKYRGGPGGDVREFYAVLRAKYDEIRLLDSF